MYSLSKGPTKINTATRNVRGLPKHRDNVDFYESSVKKRHDGYINSPRPTFNGSKVTNHHITAKSSSEPVEFASLQHEEITTYLLENWKKVCKECEQSKRKDNESIESGPLWYKEKTPNPKLSNFKPFDLEEWWGERLWKKVNES